MEGAYKAYCPEEYPPPRAVRGLLRRPPCLASGGGESDPVSGGNGDRPDRSDRGCGGLRAGFRVRQRRCEPWPGSLGTAVADVALGSTNART